MIKKWYKHYILKESLKEIELNRILDKISKGESLTIREDDFLNLYNQTQDADLNDYAYLSRNLAIDKISDYLEKKKKVWCDLNDRNGKIGDLIIKVYKPEHKLFLRHGEHLMEDNMLYNITYNIKKDEYSLTTQDEYYEEIEVNK
jgi:peptidoglycan/xylan/chitin deacetylase (PgdA/CDA1 family)